MFDTLAYAEKLKAAGIPDPQARAHAEGLLTIVEQKCRWVGLAGHHSEQAGGWHTAGKEPRRKTILYSLSCTLE